MTLVADARPTKQFFIQNLTRDLSLEDAILDLVDNSVDAFVRTRNVDVSPQLLRLERPEPPNPNGQDALVSLKVSEDQFSITDRCGGIDLHHAAHTVFRLGRPEGAYAGSLGVYGIGLKRAIFKIGRKITIESRTVEQGFRVKIDVREWAKDDENWELPIEVIEGVPSAEQEGTSIVITDLTPEVVLRINDGTLLRRLRESIATTYSLFLDRFLTLELNAVSIQPKRLPVATSEQLPAASQTLQWNGVTAELVAGLASRVDGEWSAERAGWYVLCNGRVIVSANKDDHTGWGLSGPQFVSKYRGFVGIAFFFSKDPSQLPWTTTKRGLNLESAVYQAARKEMSAIARPVLDFLNNMYPSDPTEHVEERKLVAALKDTDIKTVLANPARTFSPPVISRSKRRRSTVSIQYSVEKRDVERIRKKIAKPHWSASQIGRYTFDQFLRMEFPE